MNALDLAGLRITLAPGHGSPQAVRGVDLAIAPGEMLCLVGESGSGKSLTALSVLGLLPARADRRAERLAVVGADLRAATEAQWRTVRGDKATMIFQDPSTSLDPVWTIGEQMIEGFLAHRPAATRRQALERAEAMLARTGIDRPALRLRQYPHELSGGQRQRVMIATALMTEPSLLIADEPTTALDATVQAQILAILADLKRDPGLAILFITHDLALAARHADTVAVMYAGEIVETGPRASVFADPRHPYTQALLACRPGGAQIGAIPGTVPGLAPPPSGCAFKDRCAHALPACEATVPATARAGGGFVRCLRASEALPAPRPHVAPPPAPVERQGGAAVSLGDVVVRYPGRRRLFGHEGETLALRGVSLDVPRGGVLGVVGESGSGKSTLARVLLGLRAPDGGTVSLFGRPLAGLPRKERARLVQPVFQDPYGSLNPRRSIEAIVRLPLDVHDIGPRADRPKVVRDMLQRCGLPERLLSAKPGQLSGGQRQRVAIATALVMRPALLVCDEPTSALDVSVQAQVLALLQDLRAAFGLTYVFISHDLAVVRSIADTVAVMKAGEVVEHGPAEQVFTAPRHPYTVTLLESA